MIAWLCPGCGSEAPTTVWSCPACGRSVATEHGFACFAPDVETAGYDAALFAELAAVEDASFWFRGRNRLLLWALRRWFAPLGSFLEVGCGTGFVLRGVAERYPAAEVWGSDLFVEGLEFARGRVPGAGFVQADARTLPFRDAFDVVGAFDVLEHIEDDRAAVTALAAAARPGGRVVVTVPQHPQLWSAFDEASHHVRRYRRAELVERLREAGLELLHVTSFVTLLLPAMAASRLRPSTGDAGVAEQLRHGRLAERALGAVTAAELALIERGVRFPAGGSLLAVARRPFP